MSLLIDLILLLGTIGEEKAIIPIPGSKARFEWCTETLQSPFHDDAKIERGFLNVARGRCCGSCLVECCTPTTFEFGDKRHNFVIRYCEARGLFRTSHKMFWSDVSSLYALMLP